MIVDNVEQGTNDTNVPVKRQLAILAGILLLLFGTGYVPKLLHSLDSPPETERTDRVEPSEQTMTEPEDAADHFDDVTIRAESAYVWDLAKQRSLYSKNPDRQLPLASITKLMTALVAYELLEGTTSVTISDEAIRQDGNSGLSAGERFVLADLLDLTLLTSSNDGALAIASAAGAFLVPEGDATTFVRAMNVRASELGLTQTYFRNPTGLDISESESGAYSSARDITFLMEHILTHYPEILESTQEATASIENDAGAAHQVENTNPTISRIPGLIGSKTGYTDLAGGNLTIAFNAALNRPVVIVVMGSTRTGRFEDVLTLANRARAAIHAQ